MVTKNTTRNGKTYDVLSIQGENGHGTKICGKGDISKETKKEETNKEGRNKQTNKRRKDIFLTPISFRCSLVVGPGKDFVAIWIPLGLSSGLSP